MSSSDMWTLTPVLCVQHTFERYWNYQHFVTKQRESCKSSCSPSISHSRVAFEAGRTAQKRAWQIPIKVGIWQRSGSNENVETFSGNLCWCQKWELCHASFHMIVTCVTFMSRKCRLVKIVFFDSSWTEFLKLSKKFCIDAALQISVFVDVEAQEIELYSNCCKDNEYVKKNSVCKSWKQTGCANNKQITLPNNIWLF